MARIAPYRQGEVIRIRYHGPGQAPKLYVVSPDGSEHLFPAARGHVDLWLAQPGAWVYRWGPDEQPQAIVVLPERYIEPPRVIELAPIPAMQIMSRPRI